MVHLEPGPIDGDERQPFGPLPVGEGVAGARSLHVDQSSCIVSAITPAQRLRDATALIFCNVIDDSLSLVQPCSDMCAAFSAACGMDTGVERVAVLRALMSAEMSVISLCFLWERDGMSLLRHDMSLESLLYEFHELRRDSYLSLESVLRSLGPTSCSRFPVPQVDRDRLMELATYGMIVSEPPGFRPCPSPLWHSKHYS